jgi:hypothetical protein
VNQGVVDTYSATDDVLTRVYGGLVSATHVISFNILSTVNVSATGGTKWLQFDYVDVWDGTEEPKGLFQHEPREQDAGRVYLSSDWTATPRIAAISGTFIQDGTNAWFLFTGVSVTVIGVTDNVTPSKAEIFIDGVVWPARPELPRAFAGADHAGRPESRRACPASCRSQWGRYQPGRRVGRLRYRQPALQRHPDGGVVGHGRRARRGLRHLAGGG